MSTNHTQAECDLTATQGSIDYLLTHLQVLVRRFAELEKIPGGRQQLRPEQRIEYDLIGGALGTTARLAAKARGEA